MPATADARAGRAAFTHPGFVLFQIARFLIVSAVEMQAVAVGWQVYEITKRPLDLGYVGLAQFLPAILLFPVSGHVSDRFERRNVLSACYAGYAVCFALLLGLAQRNTPSITAIYVVLVVIGVVRSFNSTASRAILPQTTPRRVTYSGKRSTSPAGDHRGRPALGRPYAGGRAFFHREISRNQPTCAHSPACHR